jgi:hypothetical protein
VRAEAHEGAIELRVPHQRAEDVHVLGAAGLRQQLALLLGPFRFLERGNTWLLTAHTLSSV